MTTNEPNRIRLVFLWHTTIYAEYDIESDTLSFDIIAQESFFFASPIDNDFKFSFIWLEYIVRSVIKVDLQFLTYFKLLCKEMTRT